MPERELKRRQGEAAKDRSSVEEQEDHPAVSDKGEKLKAELDELLDEIDEVLEDNAEEFVRSYVQKGGE
jgi:ubiquitin-like protein Pup